MHRDPSVRRGAGGDGRLEPAQHGASGLLARVRASTSPCAEAEARTLEFLAPLVAAGRLADVRQQHLPGPALPRAPDAAARDVLPLPQPRREHAQGAGAALGAAGRRTAFAKQGAHWRSPTSTSRSASCATTARGCSRRPIRGAAASRGRLSAFWPREEQPGLDDGVGIERHALDALLDQPAREVGMIGRALAADADVLACACGRRRWPCCSSAFTASSRSSKSSATMRRVAVEAERELRHVVRADRHAVEVLEDSARRAARWSAARTS